MLWSEDAGTDVPDPVWGDPRPVADLPAVTDVALGHHRGCAVVAGDAWCWQRRNYSCVVLASQSVSCWGFHPALEPAPPPCTPPSTSSPIDRTPVEVAGLSDITEVDVGLMNLCALDQSGSISCLGTCARDGLGRPRYVLDPVRLEAFG